MLLLGGLLVLGVAWGRSRNVDGHPTSEARGTAALERVHNWATWMTGIQTAAIAVFGFWLEKKGGFARGTRDHALAVASLVAFGLSILVATWVLSCLPSIEQRLVEGVCETNDVFEQGIYLMPVANWLRLGVLTTVFHSYFVVGAVAFGWLALRQLDKSG